MPEGFDKLGLRYGEFISPMIMAIKQLNTKIEKLEVADSNKKKRMGHLEQKLEKKHKIQMKRIKDMKDVDSSELSAETLNEKKEFPAHWGEPPTVETKDVVKLPGQYGFGSSTLKNWIEVNMKSDRNEMDEIKTVHLRILDTLKDINERLTKLEGDSNPETQEL